MIIGFAKYEGTGNDFIIIDARLLDFEFTPEFIASLCDRHFGIGADGLMLLELGSRKVDFDTQYFNSDGFEAPMGPNAGRCISLYAHHQGIGGRQKVFSVAGAVRRARIAGVDDLRGTVGLQLDDPGKIQRKAGRFIFNTEPPHCVEFVSGIDDMDVTGEGRAINGNPAYGKKGLNVDFVQITGEGTFRIRTYGYDAEDEVLASGTGAAVAAFAVHAAKQPDCKRFMAKAEGGELEVSFNTGGDGLITDVWLRGEARKVFHGKFETDNFTVLI